MTADAAALLDLARTYCAKSGLSMRQLGTRVGYERLFIRLAGGRCKPETVERALVWLAANWPSDVAWPAGIVRPEAPAVEAATVTEEKAMPPVLFEEDEEAEAERIADEKAHALFVERLHETERKRALARRQEEERIRAAHALLERADPMLLAEARYRKAVEGVPLYDDLKPPPGPSLGGLPPGQMDEVARKEASAEQAWQNELRARERSPRRWRPGNRRSTRRG